MAPRKTAPKTGTVASGRSLKSRIIAEKPKLKIPTIVKVKIPRKKLDKAAVFNGISQNTEVLAKKSKDLTIDDKLELANKVARAQLDKSEPIVFPPDLQTRKEVKVVKRRGPKKKSVVPNKDDGSTTEASIGTESEEVKIQPTVTIPKPKRKNVRKVPINTAKAPANPVKRTQPLKRKLSSPTNETPDAKKPTRKWTQSRITDMKIVVRRNSTQSQGFSSSKSDKSRIVTIAKPKIVRKRGPRGKKKDSTEDPVIDSPSILTQTVAMPLAAPVMSSAREAAKTAIHIESRKSSLNSELSWTKDISDSSNMTSLTPVKSTDIVVMDNKLPMLSLHKIIPVKNPSRPSSVEKERSRSSSIEREHSRSPSVEREFSPRTPSDDSSSSSDSDSDSVSTTRCNSCKESEVVDVNSLNLSTSSESHRSPILTQKNIKINTMNNTVTKIDRALDKLAMSLKKIDMEIINWVGYQNEDININNKKIKDKIFQHLQEESNIILQCQHVNKLLTENEEIPNKESANTEVKSNEAIFVKPSDVTLPKTVNKTGDPNLDKASHSSDKIDNNERKFDVNENFALDNIPYVSFDHNFDDEDALSLYAESIGFESHRNSISSPPHNPAEFEEYIPQPVKNVLPNNPIVYNPTKINSNTDIPPVTVQNVRTATMICEKQNADSTSVFREANQYMNHMDGIEKLPVASTSTANFQIKKGPCLLASIYRSIPGAKSTVFKGMCFFNLIDSCKNFRCRFPHVQPSPIDISGRLVRLSEEIFIQEYMLMKNWPGLRRKFGLCFINECKRRDLTRFLLEMAIDFFMKANPHSKEDSQLKIHVLEEALLILNKLDLSTFEDLLTYDLGVNKLCNIFMETIANTQNFSRFKLVFIKLTQFIIANNEKFSLSVAEHILERVAILPFEEPSARALISIIEHTDPVIFENSMMGQFKKQLASNQNLLGRLLEVKERAGVNRMVVSPEFNPAVPPPVIRQEVEMMTSPLYPDRMQRYTSPDTTHLDSMQNKIQIPQNKPPDEPIITRTINFNRPFPTVNYSSSSSESTDEYPRTPKPNSLFSSWRDRSIFNEITPQRLPNFRRMDRKVSYATPSKFPHHPRPY